MKDKGSKTENKNEKEDNTFSYAIVLLGLIILGTILIVLKLIGLF